MTLHHVPDHGQGRECVPEARVQRDLPVGPFHLERFRIRIEQDLEDFQGLFFFHVTRAPAGKVGRQELVHVVGRFPQRFRPRRGEAPDHLRTLMVLVDRAMDRQFADPVPPSKHFGVGINGCLERVERLAAVLHRVDDRVG
jgi:hypothetical protein